MEQLKEEAVRREQKRQKKVAKRRAKNLVPRAFVDEDDDESTALSSSSSTATTTLSETRDNFVPPALLLPTGSPHTYVSKLAAQTSDINPRDLFPPSEMQKLPNLFRHHTFTYDGVERLSGTGGGTDANNNTSTAKVSRTEVPQVAFLGRSNVGKSSLVNALMRRELARCSKQPGRTQQVHRFALVSGNNNSNSKQQQEETTTTWGVFLDLPGYGYAVAPDDVLDEWQRRTQQVLRREFRHGHLRRIFLLIDARTGVTELDQTVLQWLDDLTGGGGIPHTLVWTKTDAVSKPKLIRGLNQAFMWYQHQLFRAEEDQGVVCGMSPVIHTTSTKGAGQGLVELLSAIEAEFLVEDEY